MIHFDTSDKVLGTLSSGYVILKMTISYSLLNNEQDNNTARRPK